MVHNIQPYRSWMADRDAIKDFTKSAHGLGYVVTDMSSGYVIALCRTYEAAVILRDALDSKTSPKKG